MDENNIRFFGNIQIFRNVEKYPFVSSMTAEDKQQITKMLIEVLKAAGYKCQLLTHEMILSNKEYLSFLYRISFRDSYPVLHISGDKTLTSDVYITLFKEDHITYNVCLSQSQKFSDVYAEIAKLVRAVETALPSQANLRYGYLSSNVERTGLGMTLSYTMHGIGIKNKMDEDFIIEMLDRGYRIERMLLDDKELNFVHIVSVRQYGVSEEDLLKEFEAGIDTFVGLESRELIKYYDKNKQVFDDKILRSFGMLNFIESITFVEAVNLLDDILLGQRVHLLEYNTAKIPRTNIVDLIISIFSSDISVKNAGKYDDIRKNRAALIKTYLKKIRACNREH